MELTKVITKSQLHKEKGRGQKEVLWIKTKRDSSNHMQDKENIKQLQAQLGNLEVQVADYRQIVAELTEKLQAYESQYGKATFTSGSSDKR